VKMLYPTLRGVKSVKVKRIEIQRMDTDDPELHLKWHRYDEQGKRLPCGFTGHVVEKLSSLPIGKESLEPIRRMCEEMIVEHEGGDWQRLGVGGIVLHRMDASYFNVMDQERHLGVRGGGISLFYHRCDNGWQKLPPWFEGRLWYERAFHDRVRVNHGDLENITDPQEMAAIMAKLDGLMAIAEKFCRQLDGLEGA